MTGLEMKYFVLKPAGDGPYSAASRAAMKAYADVIETENYGLSHELQKWVIEEQGKTNERSLLKRLAEEE